MSFDAANAVENLVGRSNVATLAGRAMDTEDADRQRRPGSAPHLPSHHPPLVLRNLDRNELSQSKQKTTSPARGARGMPEERILGPESEVLSRRDLRRSAFLPEDDIWSQGSEDARPVTWALGAPPAQEVVGDKTKGQAREGGA
jgi:hypothetical protein